MKGGGCLRRLLKEKRGEGFVDVCVLVLSVALVLALVVRIAPVFVAKQNLDDDRGCTAVCRAAVFAAVCAIIGTAERSATGGGRAGALYGVAVHPACRPVRIYCRSLKGTSHGTENSEYYKAIPG